MELSAVGESVFAAESIIKRRIRRVLASFFHPKASPSRLITQPFVLYDGDGQSSDNLNVLRILFFRRVAGNISSNGRVGLRSEYNNRGRVGQRSILAARTTAARQPGVLGSRMFPRFISAVVCRNTAYCVSGSLCAVVRAGNYSSCSPPACLKVLRSFSSGWVRCASLAAT